MLRCKILFQVPLVDSAAGDELVVLFRLFQLLLLFLLIFWARLQDVNAALVTLRDRDVALD